MGLKIALLIVILLLLVLDYILVVMAYEANEKAKRMYRVWKGENRDE